MNRIYLDAYCVVLVKLQFSAN